MDERGDAFRAYASVLRTVAESVPGYRVVEIERPGTMTLILSTFGLPSLDRVLVPRLTEEEATGAIDQVETEARAAGVAVGWWLDPGTRPEGLEPMLLERGYELTRRYPVMSRDLEGLPALEPPLGVELGWAEGAKEIRESQVVAGTAFGRPQPAVESMADAMAASEVTGDRRLAVATARIDGQMVGSGMLWLAGTVAGILNVGTLEEARGRGIGFAVTLALLWRARELGGAFAALHASTQGFPIYLRMGFRHDGDVRVLRGPAGLA